MAVVLLIIGILLMLLGVVGIVVPAIPDAILVYAGMLVIGWSVGWDEWALGTWIALGILAVLMTLADVLSSLIGTKLAKASKPAMILAGIGAVIGLIVGNLAGLVLGPFLGAVIGELIHGSRGSKPFKSALGATIGLLSGLFMSALICVLMICVFVIGWIW